MCRAAILTITTLILMTSACGGGGESDGDGSRFGYCNSIGKVTNGDDCSTSGSPVAKIILLDSSSTPVGICSGTLITSDDVLTAAHCFRIPGVAGAAVEVEGKSLPVARIAINPLYSNVTGDPFDTAVVSLSAQSTVPPVPLIISAGPGAGTPVGVYGYGKTETGSSGKLRAAQMIIRAVDRGQFAATFVDTGASICSGDSGGPVIGSLNGVNGIGGVTSWTYDVNRLIDGSSLCQTGTAAGFVRVDIRGNFNFIRSVVPDVGTL